MENAAEALKMAGAVMLFVLALSIILFSFSQARQSADTILDYRDRETGYIDAQNYYQMEGTEREVGLETVIPTIFRAYLENYKIVFDGLSRPLYQIKRGTQLINKYTLDLETRNDILYTNVTLGTNETKIEFLKGILNGEYANGRDEFSKKYSVNIPEGSNLYSQLSGKKITECLGVYYQNPEIVSEANRIEKRVITYKITNR